MDSEPTPEQNVAYISTVPESSSGSLDGPRAAANPIQTAFVMAANPGKDAPQRIDKAASDDGVGRMATASAELCEQGPTISEMPKFSPRSEHAESTHSVQKRKQKIAMLVDWHDDAQQTSEDNGEGFGTLLSRAHSQGLVCAVRGTLKRAWTGFQNDKGVKSLMDIMNEVQLEESMANKKKPVTSRLLNSKYFSRTMTSLIILNALYIGIETDLAEEDNIIWFVIESVFTACFSFELLLQMYVQGRYFWYPIQGWNLFDFVLVTTAVIDFFVSIAMMLDADSGDSSVMSIFLSLRTLRVARIIRPLRLLKFFKELWLLFSGLLSSLRTLFWTWILILLTIYVFGIFTTHALGIAFGCVQEEPGAAPVVNTSMPNASVTPVASTSDCSIEGSLIEEKFGTVARSMYTLFQMITTEGWAEVARASMVLSPLMWIFFVAFMSLTTFAIMNVVIAVIVENTLLQAFDLEQDVMKKIEDEKCSAMNKIFDVFEIADSDGDQRLNKQEFLDALEKPKVKLLLHDVEIDLRNAGILFDILDYDQSEYLDAAEFLDGCMRARGDARAKDVLALQCDLYRTQRYLKDAVERLTDSVDDRFERLLEDAQWLAKLVAPGGGDSTEVSPTHYAGSAEVASDGQVAGRSRMGIPVPQDADALRNTAQGDP